MAGIFISYRRHDTAGYSGRIRDRLAARFGDAAVFIDIGGIAPGGEFMQVIENRIPTCSAVLAIIGEEWISPTGGTRRLDNPGDPVRNELETALRHHVPVIPVLVGSAAMPQPADLPDSIRSLAGRNAIRVTHELFDESMSKLIQALSPQESLPVVPAPSLKVTVGLALLGAVGTIFFFNYSSVTSGAPIGLGETTMIFVCWVLLIVTVRWLIIKIRNRWRSA